MSKNLYLTPAVKKFIPKITDNQVEYTGIKLCTHSLVIGGTGAGKSNLLCNFILESSKPKGGTFHSIYICRKTHEPLYQWLEDELKHQIHFFDSVESFPDVTEFPDSVDPANEGQILIVFDDTVTDRNKSAIEKIDRYFCFGRKKNLSCIYLSQSFYDTPGFVRKQICNLLMLSVKGKRELSSILTEYGSLDCSSGELYEIFKYATKQQNDEEAPFLKITTSKCPINKKFSRMWTDYIPIDDEE